MLHQYITLVGAFDAALIMYVLIYKENGKYGPPQAETFCWNIDQHSKLHISDLILHTAIVLCSTNAMFNLELCSCLLSLTAKRQIAQIQQRDNSVFV